MKKVCFRVDASREIGSGHVVRCLTLAKALQLSGWKPYFLVSSETRRTLPQIEESGYAILSENAEPESAELLIVDHYQLSEEYESACRRWAKKILVIDDLANRPHDCDLLVDQTYNRSPYDYKKLVPHNCEVMAGTGYAILRDEFLSLQNSSLSSRQSKGGKIQNILISLGQTNVHNITTTVLNDIGGYSLNTLHINVVLGASAYDLNIVEEAIKDIQNHTNHIVELHLDALNMAELMSNADVAIGAGGTTAWERCCLGLPAIVIVIADNQLKVTQELDAQGAIINLGDHNSLQGECCRKALDLLHHNRNLMNSMSMKSLQVCDGKGTQRLVRRIERFE